MSHRDDTPLEVDEREVEHGWLWDDFYVPEHTGLGVGTVRDREWWGKQTDWNAEAKRIEERERKRQALGGFGFCIDRA